jgi:hypothetical protein
VVQRKRPLNSKSANLPRIFVWYVLIWYKVQSTVILCGSCSRSTRNKSPAKKLSLEQLEANRVLPHRVARLHPPWRNAVGTCRDMWGPYLQENHFYCIVHDIFPNQCPCFILNVYLANESQLFLPVSQEVCEH